MLEQAAALAAEYDMLPSGGVVLCAVSGGADSMCLLHYLHTGAEAGGYTLHAAHFDHNLRGAESRRDADFVANWCKEWGIPFHLGSADVGAQARTRGEGVEETARALRYAFLQETAQAVGATRIATAHNADDNAETLLLHLVRGTGLQGLTGIPPRRGTLVRPLLTTPRAEILAYLEAYHLPHVEDGTNSDTRYARNKLRHEVLPVLRALNPRLTESLNDAVGLLRKDNDCLNAQAANAAASARPRGGGWSIPAALVARQPDPIASRMVRWLFSRLGEYDFRAAHLHAVVALCRSADPSASADLPHGLVARRVYGDLLLARRGEDLDLPTIPLDPAKPMTVELEGWRLAFRPAVCPDQHPKTGAHAFLSLASVRGVPVLRPRRTGDEIALPHRDTKSLKKLMIDAKIPRLDRERYPVLADEEGVLFLPGFGPAASRLAAPGEPAWEVAAVPASPAQM